MKLTVSPSFTLFTHLENKSQFWNTEKNKKKRSLVESSSKFEQSDFQTRDIVGDEMEEQCWGSKHNHTPWLVLCRTTFRVTIFTYITQIVTILCTRLLIGNAFRLPTNRNLTLFIHFFFSLHKTILPQCAFGSCSGAVKWSLPSCHSVSIFLSPLRSSHPCWCKSWDQMFMPILGNSSKKKKNHHDVVAAVVKWFKLVK